MKAKERHQKPGKVEVFAIEDQQCIWMKAGVVNFKLCDNAFDCLHCPFDHAMTRAMEKKPEKTVSWREVYRKKPYNQKECRHMLSGKIQFRLCGNSYQCHACEFDQMLEEEQRHMPVAKAVPHVVSGFQVADGYYYHRGHSWARVEHGGLVRVGMDDFSMRLLGYLSEFRLPKLGAPVHQTETGWSVRREEKVARLLAPMEGVVVATNYKVLEDPDLAKKDPYGDGWLLMVEPRELKRNLKNLLLDQEAELWVKAEAAKLEEMVMGPYGMPLAATGGEVVEDIVGSVNHLGWDDLVHEFLLTS